MGFISKAERKVNSWIAKETGLPPPSRSVEERTGAYIDFVERQNAAATAHAQSQPTVIRVPSTTITVAPDQETQAIAAPRRADDGELARRRAAAGGGQSGLRLPPVGVRGGGALPRTSLLGR